MGSPLELTRKMTLIRTARQTNKLQTEGWRYKRAAREPCLGGAVCVVVVVVGGAGGGSSSSSRMPHSRAERKPLGWLHLLFSHHIPTKSPSLGGRLPDLNPHSESQWKSPRGQRSRLGQEAGARIWGGCVGLACVISPAACLSSFNTHVSTLLSPHPDPFRLLPHSSQLFSPHFKKSFPISKSQL